MMPTEAESPAVRPAPDRTARITRPTIGAHIRVQSDENSPVGVVVASDEWHDTLRLRGVAPNSQVLTEWFPDSGTIRIWHRSADLEVVQTEPTPRRPS